MRICVYGAASEEIADIYKEKTEAFGAMMAARGHSLVYGGGARGLMGAAARGVKGQGGHVLGIAPAFFDADGALFDRCDEFLYPDTMRERKQLLEDGADAFVILPGGIGTFDEFFETLVLKSLGKLQKPIAVYNIEHYYDPLCELLEHAVRSGFLAGECRGMYRFFEDGEAMLSYLEKGVGEDEGSGVF